MEIAEVTKALETIKKQQGVLAVYIFGSAATGKQNKNSDIDICVILEDMDDSLDIVVDASSKLPKNFDIVNFYRLPIQIRHRVFKEGRSLYEKDQNRVSVVIFRTIKEYLDMKPGLDRIYDAILTGARQYG